MCFTAQRAGGDASEELLLLLLGEGVGVGAVGGGGVWRMRGSEPWICAVEGLALGQAQPSARELRAVARGNAGRGC